MNVNTFVSLYKTIVRSVLEYANCIWSPLLKRQSIDVENVQRRATKLLPITQNMSYLERLKFLKLPTLKYRRIRGDLIQLYKIINEIDNIDYRMFFNVSHVNFTRGDKYKIYITGNSTCVRKNSFISRTVKNWNNLTFNAKSSKSINAFKTAIDRELHNMKFDYDE